MNDNLFLFDDFITELSETASPGHLDQLELFYENTDELFGTLTDIITASQLAMTYASVRQKDFPALPASEPAGYLLQWPSPRCGLASIIRSEQSGQCNSFQAVFPFINEGVRHTCRILKTRLFSSRLEAQLEVVAGEDEELALTFYDVNYLADRVAYSKDAVFQFMLRGLAYFFEVFVAEPVVTNDPEPVAFETAGMAALFPREDLGADHYEIQGPVKEVKEPDFEMLGQKIRLVRVTIAHTSGGEDVDFDLCVTQKVLGKGRVPVPGDDIRAVIWLQGHLWGPGEE